MGAASLCYTDDGMPSPLETKILPRFESVLLKKYAHVGETGEFIARLVLLLAMDCCARELSNEGFYQGEWYSVTQFLLQLNGGDAYGYSYTAKDGYVEVMDDLIRFFSTWIDWKVGFSHFHELHEVPTQELLEQLLERRAAGVFPKGQIGADLFISIFKQVNQSREVSMILIQVKNRIDGDGNFRESTLVKLRPEFVFKGKSKKSPPTSPLVNKPIASVPRIFMDFRGKPKQPGRARFFLQDTSTTDISFVLCMRGKRWWAGDASPDAVSCITRGISAQMKRLLNCQLNEESKVDKNEEERSAGAQRIIPLEQIKKKALSWHVSSSSRSFTDTSQIITQMTDSHLTLTRKSQTSFLWNKSEKNRNQKERSEVQTTRR